MDNLIVFILTCRKPQMRSKTGKGDAGNLIVIHPGTFVIVHDHAKSAVLIPPCNLKNHLLKCKVKLSVLSSGNQHVAAENRKSHGADDSENKCCNQVRLRADLP